MWSFHNAEINIHTSYCYFFSFILASTSIPSGTPTEEVLLIPYTQRSNLEASDCPASFDISCPLFRIHTCVLPVLYNPEKVCAPPQTTAKGCTVVHTVLSIQVGRSYHNTATGTGWCWLMLRWIFQQFENLCYSPLLHQVDALGHPIPYLKPPHPARWVHRSLWFNLTLPPTISCYAKKGSIVLLQLRLVQMANELLCWSLRVLGCTVQANPSCSTVLWIPYQPHQPRHTFLLVKQRKLVLVAFGFGTHRSPFGDRN